MARTCGDPLLLAHQLLEYCYALVYVLLAPAEQNDIRYSLMGTYEQCGRG